MWKEGIETLNKRFPRFKKPSEYYLIFISDWYNVVKYAE